MNIVFAVTELNDETLVTSGIGCFRVWDKLSGECLRSVETSSPVKVLLALGRRRGGGGRSQQQLLSLLSGLIDGRILEWRTTMIEFTFELFRVFYGHSGCVNSLCELSDRTIVSASSDRTLIRWDYYTNEQITTFKGHSETVERVVQLLCNTSKPIASGSRDHEIRIWDVKSGECLNVLQGHCGVVQALVEMPDGSLVSGSEDRMLFVWDTQEGSRYGADGRKREWTIVNRVQLSHEIMCLALLDNGKYIVIGKSNGEIELREGWV